MEAEKKKIVKILATTFLIGGPLLFILAAKLFPCVPLVKSDDPELSLKEAIKMCLSKYSFNIVEDLMDKP